MTPDDAPLRDPDQRDPDQRDPFLRDTLQPGPGQTSRREARSAPIALADGALALRCPGRADLPVLALRNVSPSGASLLVAQPLPTGTALALLLAQDGLRLEFAAVVAWCRPAEPGEVAGEGSAVAPGTVAGAAPGQRADGAPACHALGLQLLGAGSFAAMVGAGAP